MKILLVEDDADLRYVLRLLLERNEHEVIEAADGEEGWEKLQREHIQLVITDWMMPRLDGAALIQRIRSSQRTAYVYIIMLTARSQADDIVSGLEIGADDYLPKPFNHRELQARVEIAVRLLAVERDLREARDRLQTMATHDDLTGLLNRRAVAERGAAELNRAQRQRHFMSVTLLDLDQFRLVNERYGHAVGDQALRLTAQAVTEAMRSYDFAGRWSGEEFLIILPGARLDEALKVAERVRHRIAGTNSLLPNDTWLSLSASLGVAEADPAELLTFDQLLQRADEALAQAKQAGRNRVCGFIPPEPAESASS